MSVDYTVFDSDNHYYEAVDAFTRYIDPVMAKRCMQWAEIDGKTRLLVGGKVNRFIPNPTFDPVALPGSLDEYFRGRNPEAKDMKTMFGVLEPIRAEYRDRDARLQAMDGQGLAGAFLFPTLGVGMEVSLVDDPEALVAAFGAFNRWLEDDWGYCYRDRIFAAPMITLVDADAAVYEVERVLDLDARIVCIKGGPVQAAGRSWSPGDPVNDPVWARLAEAGVVVGIHSGDAGYTRYLSDWEPTGTMEAFRHSPLRTVLGADRPPYETFAAIMCHGIVERFPNLRFASVEAGSDWVAPLLSKLKKVYGQHPSAFASDPVQSFREHVWVAPYYEDDLGALKASIGVDRILFGSDWPHAEGLPEPRRFDEDLRRHGFADEEIERIMVDNGAGLARRRIPAPA
jgi:predicted TIM-barrel fold metal-dependent hydrolase